MKARWAGLVAIVVLASCSSTSSTSTAPSWEGGAKFEAGTRVALGELGEGMKDRQVQIEGTVTKRCMGKGCWVEVSDGKVSAIAKSLDDSVLFPKDAVGQRVLVQGIVRVKPASECGKGGGEGSHKEGEGSSCGHEGPGHECPKPEILVEILGAKLYPAN